MHFSLNDDDVCIVSAVRTPLGSLGGVFSYKSATDLGGICIREVVMQSKVVPEDVEEVFMGNVCSSNIGQAPVTQSIIKGGLSVNTPGTTINKG
jgi:acetyl-CoA C-acetyltransferase